MGRVASLQHQTGRHDVICLIGSNKRRSKSRLLEDKIRYLGTSSLEPRAGLSIYHYLPCTPFTIVNSFKLRKSEFPAILRNLDT